MRRVCWSLLFSVLIASAALAQMGYAEQIWEQLTVVSEMVSEEGLTVRSVIISTLDEGAGDSWTMDFEGAGLVVAVCDTDCKDIDLEVKSGKQTLDCDEENDDYPLVLIPKPGRYTINVNMHKCSADPCFFGFAIYE